MSYAAQPWNWSPGSSIATGSDHVRPASNDWLTTMSEFVTASYGFAGAGSVLLRMSDHATARWSPSVGSAAMLPADQERNVESW